MTDLMTYPHDFRVQQDSHTVGNHPQHFSHLLHHVCKSSQIHFEFRPLCEFLYMELYHLIMTLPAYM